MFCFDLLRGRMLATPEIVTDAVLPITVAERVSRWLRDVPLYRGRSVAAQPLALISPGEFEHLPFITKQDIRRGFPGNFLHDKGSLEDLIERDLVELEHTSGTSEERTPLLMGRGWWAEQERRALKLNVTAAAVLARNAEARRVTISSPVCSGDICYTGVPSRQERTLGNALFLSLTRLPFLWSEHDLARMAAEAVDWQPEFLDVDPVYGVLFALYCEREGIQLPSLRFIICTYEFVSAVHRRILLRVFGVPVLDLYGSTETGHLLMENEKGWMRPSRETAYLEVINPDQNGVGELVVTTLTNEYMPLIRYRIGDLVQKEIHGTDISYTVHGRFIDAVHTAGESRVTTLQIDNCFVKLNGLIHYQLARHGASHWVLRLVPDRTPPTPAEVDTLRGEIQGLLETEDLTVQMVKLVMPEKSGKFRLVYPGQ